MEVINNYRTCIVLAAGLGSRLVGGTNGFANKPLVEVEGISLLLRTLKSLELACDRAVIVLGFAAGIIRTFVEQQYSGSMSLVFVLNEQYQLSNGVSVLAGGRYIKGDFILAMADHIMDDELVELARNHSPVRGSAALLVDYKLETIFDMDDATKVLEKNGRIILIGKEIADYNCVDTGLFVCTVALLDILADLYRSQGDVSLSQGIQQLAENGLMYTVDIKDGFWQDVDTPEMLEYAQKRLGQRNALPPSERKCKSIAIT